MMASTIISRVALYLSLVSLGLTDSTSTIQGTAEYSGTPVQTNPNGIPTLVYNCAKLPSICKNVNTRNPIAGGGDSAPGTLTNPAGGDHIELNIDTSAVRHRQRNQAACPGSWKLTHNPQQAFACPEPNQPLTVRRGQSIITGGYNGVRFRQNVPGLTRASDGALMIADQTGNYQGVIWTCDEWPPAISLEGGVGASTYCAPNGGGCSSAARALAGGVASERNEQGFQSSAHGTVKRWARAAANDRERPGVFTFHFRTAWNANANSYATRVIYSSTNFQQGTADGFLDYSKRDTPAGFVHTTDFYDNGTEHTISRAMTDSEARQATINKRQLTTVDLATNISLFPPMKQKFETLPAAPLLDVTELQRGFVLSQLSNLLNSVNETIGGILDGAGNLINGTAILQPAASIVAGITSGLGGILRPSQTPSSVLLSSTASRLSSVRTTAVSSSSRAPAASASALSLPTTPSTPQLLRRQTASNCGPNSPCPDGSCCNNDGNCGFGPENCGAGNCTNNCDAKANCGKDSEGGSVSCPLNVCCSAFGYCGVGSEFCDSPLPEFPCQEGFGSCNTVTPPSCGGSSAFQRSIGYWQAYNVRTRQCNRIQASDINTDGLTHLYLAFATINPVSFEVQAADAADPQLYEEFVALKRPGLETWLAIGGWDFSDPGPTRTTWSDMASTQAGRSSFINSCIGIMDQYGFQGIDIDWEYPVAPDRDGRPEDMENFVALVREMRSAFGSRYGISVAIAASYWYLRGFDPKAMEPYVDWFGVMTYDLHGPWDASVRHIGPVVAGQTNIPEIYNWTLPLWYAGLEPAKLNFGLAYYGRGYTLSDRSCNSVGCTWSGPSRAAPCTNFPGVASLIEIENMIDELGVSPVLLQDDMMKVLNYGDQWIGYDDLETIEMKKRWASSHCFGGTMIWSVDLYSGSGSGDTPDGGGSANPGSPSSGGGQGGGTEGDGDAIVYIDPSIWSEENPEINCQPPCSFVLPPFQLPEPTTISIPPMTTSLEIAYPRTTVVSGSTSTYYSRVTVTTTITVPAITTTEIEVWGYEVDNTDSSSTVSSSFFVTSSITPPVMTITDEPDEEETGRPPRTRTIRPPPFPYTRPARTTDDGPSFPIVTYRPGPPRPTCRAPAICGKPCRIFCDTPCPPGFCSDSNLDFPDPIAPPGPPPPPGPSPPPGTEPSQPEDEENDQDEEEDEEQCEIEFGLPPGGDDAGSNPDYAQPQPTRTPNPTIAPPEPTPTPSPRPNPEPPRPNPDTEERDCYDSGALTGRGDAIKAVENFCEFYDRALLDDAVPERRSIGGIDSAVGGFVSIVQSVTVRNGCKFEVDRQQCRRIMRRILDECDTTSTRFKQGGTVEDNCATWRLDPQVDIDNLLCFIPLYRLGSYVAGGGC